MNMHDAVVFVYLLLAIPVILYSISVLALWGPKAVEAASVSREFRTGVDWLVIGIAISFLGTMLDNLYWTVPRTMDFLNMPQFTHFVCIGVYFDIPFRQIADIVAAYCHVRGAAEYGKANHKVLAVTLWGSGLSMFFIGVLATLAKFKFC